MEFIVNDRSLHGQFHNEAEFIQSLKVLLSIKVHTEQRDHIVRCPRALLDVAVGFNLTLREVLTSLADRNLRGVLITWLSNKGPFWDDKPLHDPNEWFEVQGGIVTETGLAEAAKGLHQGMQQAVLSFEPSTWTYTPIPVDYLEDVSKPPVRIDLDNHWALSTVEQFLQAIRPPLASWNGLVQWAREECPLLNLTKDVIRWLDGYPFYPGAAARFQVLLSTLNTIKGSFDSTGALTAEGTRIYQNHFVGKKAWFTDSSDGEKEQFKNELTFPDPENDGSTVFCPWHGKVKIEQMRMHFTFPIRHDRPLYVVYIGPKLTKR